MSSTSSMASAIYNPKYICQFSSPSINRKHHFHNLSVSVNSVSKSPNFCASICNHQLGPTPFYQWHGLRHLGISISQHSLRLENKKRGKGKGVFASLFGVGAPEALVIGVVALLVFGPKGLAEVARTLGKTLRAFQPTIRELQDVSREFKSTLEREIGLDEIQNPMQNNFSSSTNSGQSSPSTIANSEDSQMKVDPNGSPSTNNAYSSEDYLKITEEQLKAAAAQQQMQISPGESKSETEANSEDTIEEVAAVVPLPPPEKPKSET